MTLIASPQSTVSNNTWYLFNNSDSVLIFVHVIFSSSASCWLYRNNTDKEVYWPNLVIEDPRIRPISIFMGGFYTEPDSRAYDISACASELFSAIKRLDPDGLRPPGVEPAIIAEGYWSAYTTPLGVRFIRGRPAPAPGRRSALLSSCWLYIWVLDDFTKRGRGVLAYRKDPVK